MSENPPPSKEPSVTAPADQPTSFEPAFRAVHELFQARMRDARSKIDPLTDGLDRIEKRSVSDISEHSKRMKGLYVSAGLMRPTGGPKLDRTPLFDLMDRVGTPETRAVSTSLRLDELWEQRNLPADDKPGEPDEHVYWEADKQILGREGLFEPEARRHMLQEREELHTLSVKVDNLRLRVSTEMRRMILFSERERDLNELAELFKKYKYYLPAPAKTAGKKDRQSSKAQVSALRRAEASGRMMALLAEMGTVRAGPEAFNKEAARKMCADIEEVISQMDAIIKEMAAIK